jgi:GT2 family glycosyltransferase
VLHARIAVLITSHNRRHQTLACLSSLLEQQADADQYKLRVVHVDADSNDATASAIEQKFPEVELVHSDSDTYWGGGMRQAGLVAGTDEFDFHLWLNDDVVLDPDALMRLVEVARRRPDSIIVGQLRGVLGRRPMGVSAEGLCPWRSPPLASRNLQRNVTHSMEM